MESLNFERLNQLIDFYSVVGIFVLIACCLLICWLLVKLLQWAYFECDRYCEKSDKDLIKKTIEEYKKGE